MVQQRGTTDNLGSKISAKNLQIGIVRTQYNVEIVEELCKSCFSELVQLGADQNHCRIIQVPGALEIPYALKSLEKSGNFDGLVGIGVVIRGETYHFEIVSNESARGIMEVQLAAKIPIINGVLTCDTEEQAKERMVDKGRYCGRAVTEMITLQKEINGYR